MVMGRSLLQRLAVGRWWLLAAVAGLSGLAVGSLWRLAVGGWRLVVGGCWRRLVVGGWWSLRAVLKSYPAHKNLGLPKDSPA